MDRNIDRNIDTQTLNIVVKYQNDERSMSIPSNLKLGDIQEKILNTLNYLFLLTINPLPLNL